MSNISENINSPELMELKDSDKYYRQIGSKALIMTSPVDKKNYEDARRVALEKRRREEELANRVDQVEQKMEKMLGILERMESKLNAHD
jgi:BMFP domain-containing protein YqiC